MDEPMEHRMDYRPHRGGIVWPIILIGAGIIFLLNNVGVLDWNVWWSLARLWPVILIAIGLDILIGRRSLLGSLLVAVVVLGVMGAAVVYWAPSANLSRDLHTEQINQGLEGASKASVDIDAGIANLTLREGSESAGLVQGTIAMASGERLDQPQFTRSGDTANYQLHSSGPNVWPVSWRDPGFNNKRWDLQLNPDVPLQLKINAGVGNASLDLSRLKLSGLDVNAGVGSVDLTLPRAGKFSANLDAGVGRLHLVIPAGMAARIRVDRGLGGVDVPGDLQRRGDNEYATAGYESANDRVDLKINGGVGHVSIEAQAGG